MPPKLQGLSLLALAGLSPAGQCDLDWTRRHATVSERLEWVKAGMRDGILGGVKTDVYVELPLREAFLDGEIQAVHFTAFGICLHDFAVTPCPFHLNCVRGCPDYLRTRGNQKERQHLIQIQTATEQALAAARIQTVRNNGIADAWIHHCEETLEGIAKALAVDDDDERCGDSAALPDGKRCRA